MKESDAIKKFRGDNSGLVIKLHGSQFQSCLPDVLWIKKGEIKFLEFKKIDKRHVPASSWRMGQHAMMLLMRKAGAAVFYCIFSEGCGAFFLVSPEDVNPQKPFDIPDDEPAFSSCARLPH